MRQWRDDQTRNPMESMTDAGMKARVHAHDWASTPLGRAENWSPSLKWSVELILASGFPMSIRWGPDLITIYNDAYAVLLGDRHPHALGKPLRDIWPEIYSELGPLNNAILRGERARFFAEDHPWSIHRHAVPGTRALRSATARSRTRRRPTGSAAFSPPPLKRPSACVTRKFCRPSPIGSRPRWNSARANGIASGKCPKTCSALAISMATFSASTRPGAICSAGVRTRSNRCT